MLQRPVIFPARRAGTATGPFQAHIVADFLERFHGDLMLFRSEGGEHAVVTDSIDQAGNPL